MAIKYVGSAVYNGAPSGLPTIKNGDLFLYLSSGVTTLPSGYTSLATSTPTNGLPYRIARKFATADGEAGPTMTNNTYGVLVDVYRYVASVSRNTGAANNGISGVTSVVFSSAALANGDGQSVVAAMGGWSKGSTTGGASQSGWTDRVDTTFSVNSQYVLKDTATGVSSYSGWTQAFGVSDVYYHTHMLELRPEVLACDLATFTVSAQAANLRAQRVLVADAAAIAATFNDISWLMTAALIADAADITVTANGIEIYRSMPLAGLEFSVTANDANLPLVARINPETMTIDVAGGAMTIAQIVALQAASIAISPGDVVLIFNGGLGAGAAAIGVIAQDVVARMTMPANGASYLVDALDIDMIANFQWIPMKVFMDGEWKDGKLRIYRDGAWVKPNLKRRVGSDWVQV